MRLRLLLAAVALPLALWAALPLPSAGESQQQELQELQSKIRSARERSAARRGPSAC